MLSNDSKAQIYRRYLRKVAAIWAQPYFGVDMLQEEIKKILVSEIGAFNKVLDLISKETGVGKNRILFSVAYFDIVNPTITFSVVDAMDKSPIYEVNCGKIRCQFEVLFEDETGEENGD